MRRLRSCLVPLLCAAGTACTPAPPAPPAPPAESSPAPDPAPTPPAPDSALPRGAFEWVSLDEGLARAARTRQPVLVYVQAQWCPRCRELEPLFDEAQVREAAAPLIMVRHDGDEPHPALRGVIGDMDGYVPRVYFLQADGVRMSALTSGHPRYTWFYTPSMQPRLVQNMRDAVAAAPGLP